jgi:hypothetical protein
VGRDKVKRAANPERVVDNLAQAVGRVLAQEEQNLLQVQGAERHLHCIAPAGVVDD